MVLLTPSRLPTPRGTLGKLPLGNLRSALADVY